MLVKLAAVFGVLALAVGFSALFAWPVQLLWNGVATKAIDGLNTIGFLQAWGLTLLSSFLFKSSK